jgi:hypothetical protein
MCNERQKSFFLKRKRFNLEKLNMDRMIHGLKPLTMKESSWDDKKSPTFDKVKKRNQMLKSWLGYFEVIEDEKNFLKGNGVIK